MKSIVFAAFAAVWASAAMAQETTPIPFAPPVPSAFIVDEVRTMTVHQVEATKSGTSTLRYRLEFRAHGESYDAT